MTDTERAIYAAAFALEVAQHRGQVSWTQQADGSWTDAPMPPAKVAARAHMVAREAAGLHRLLGAIAEGE